MFFEHVIQFLLARGSMNTALSDGTIDVQWPSYGHVGVLKESIPILLDDCA